MVNPLYMFILFLAFGFLFAILDKMGRKVTLTLFYGVLLANFIIPLYWIWGIFSGTTSGTEISTAGFMAPISINLRFGFEEIIIVLLVNFLGLLSAIYLSDKFKKSSINGMILFMVLLMSIDGLVMTRDIFNIFVFLEILSIATYSLIAIEKNRDSLSAGFKYMLAGGIASAFILIGIIFLYRFTGTLNLDDMIGKSHLLVGKAGFLSLYLFLFAILLELKPFPANGWALDVYQAVNEGLVAIIAVASSAAIFFVLYKFLPLVPSEYYGYLGGVGLVTFFFSNLIGLKQKNPNRLLGYSSIAQMGLLLATLSILKSFGSNDLIIFQIVGGLFINHFLAKAALFWLVGIVKKNDISAWTNLRTNPSLLIFLGVFILALSGLPPFPGFWAKWDFVMILASKGSYFSIIGILLASLFEITYLFRWLGFAMKKTDSTEKIDLPISKEFPIAISAIALLVFSVVTTYFFKEFSFIQILPLVGLVLMYLFGYLPVKVKGFVAIVIISTYAIKLYSLVSGLELFFAAILVVGSLVQIIATMYRSGKREGFYPFLVMMIIAIGNLVIAKTYLSFFFQWELMTIASYFLIMKGKEVTSAGLKYIIFSMGAAYFIMTGFAFAPVIPAINLSLINTIGMKHIGILSLSLLSIGFLIKIGSLGFHVWVPDTYNKADDDTTSYLSSIVSKAGIFGFFLLAVAIVKNASLDTELLLTIIGWIGVMTAIIASIMAAFQENVKKLIAYSSIGQLGYIILALSAFNHIGWLAALNLTLNHMLFKLMIFLAIAGVIMRTKTTNMYEMGGLIKKMPWSYISVLMGIIGLSGVPPLAGFGTKWMLYNALIERRRL
ncbi:MAG: proton-conducting membrane transporter [Bacteroidetes bacterium 4572_77]|nr:MAG: proton-conducting membrane transporter [Bacteroidetes bacterium 4572_77]